MRAKYLGNGVIDNYKGVSLSPGCEFEVTDAMKTVVLATPALFRVLDDEPKRGPGRPRKDT
jgi:hypothetical protein